MIVKFKKIDERAIIPTFAHESDAGMDLYAVLDEPITIQPLERKLISTGFSMELPVGYEAQVRPRSGLALKHGITVLNTPGTIDAGYRNTVGVILINLSNTPFVVNPGDRIAQMVINEYADAFIEEVKELSDSDRGMGGFGSTGISANGNA